LGDRKKTHGAESIAHSVGKKQLMAESSKLMGKLRDEGRPNRNGGTRKMEEKTVRSGKFIGKA
jgi:hypothetical protein